MKTVITYILLLLTFSSSKALDTQNSTQKTYFQKIELNHETRTMKIFNTKGEEIVNARLGRTLDEIKPQSCATGNQNPEHICLEWERKARLDLHAYELNATAKCYNFKWTALGDIDSIIDCFQFSDKEHWYGGGQNSKSAFHFDKGFHEYSPFITGKIGDNNWGNVLKRYFISSRGAAVTIDDLSPLHTSLNGKEFCLKAQYDDFAFVNHVCENLELNYTICTSENTAILHSKLIEDAMWEGLKKQDFENIDTLINEPIWEITANAAALNEEKISNLGTDIIQLGFLKLGHILINEFWQKRIGDFTMDPARFFKFENLIHVLHRRGFKIILTIQPFISTESSSFIEAVKKELLISERSCDHRIPALTRYKSLQAAGVLDPTKIGTQQWVLKKLKDLSSNYGVDGFYLDTGISYDIPHYFQYSKDIPNPDHYRNYFVKMLSEINLIGVNAAIKRPKPPTLISLPHLESSWSGLRKLIPLMLTYGLLGYPLLLPAAIGGDFNVKNSTEEPSIIESLPDRELYIRWYQIASFMPVMKFIHHPNSFGDPRIVEITRNITQFRESKVSPLLKKYSRVALDTGLPIIRPLWMIDANDPTCHAVEDEFSIGDKMIIAPILYSGRKSRNIYLPTGVWKDGIDGSFHKGGRWINDYTVQENEIPFFENVPSIMNI